MLLVFWRSKLVYCSQKSLLNIFNSCKSLAILGKLSYFIHANNSQVILNTSKFCAGRIYRWFFWPFLKRQNANNETEFQCLYLCLTNSRWMFVSCWDLTKGEKWIQFTFSAIWILQIFSSLRESPACQILELKKII